MVKDLKEVLLDDFWIMPATPKYINNGVPYITSKNIKNEKIDFSNVNYINIEDYERISKNRPILIDDILISMIGTLGEVAVVKKSDGVFYGQNMFLVRLNKDKIYQRYFINYFKSNIVKRQLMRKQNKSTQSYLKANHIESLKIPIPDIAEQKKIANKLDKVQEIINIRKKQIEELDRLIKSQFVEMFGNINKQKELKEYIISLNAGKSLADEEECINKVLKTGSVSYDYFNENEIKNLPANYIPKDDHKVNVGDVIISRMNTTELVGAVGYVWSVDDNIYIPDRLWKANLRKDVNPIFLWQLLIQSDMKEKIQKICSGTSGSMKNISKEKFLKLKVKDISIELQNKFAEFVKQIDKQKFEVQKNLEEIQMLQESLMNKYFEQEKRNVII